jgi:Cytochrome c, mono- and diheme variants
LLLAMHVRRGDANRRAVIGGALRRHSRIALVAAPIVAITGIANSPIVLGHVRALVASDYGNLLIAKALLFSLALAIGSANFFLVKRGSFRRTLTLVLGEVAAGTLAVVVAATMVTVQPAASRVPVLSASTTASAHLYGAAGPSSLHATVTLPAPGAQQYQVSVADKQSGAPQTKVQKLILVFTPPSSSELPPERVDLKPETQPGLWGASGAYTPIVGDWSLEVIVRREGLRDVSTNFDLPVAVPLPPQRVPPPDTGIAVPAPLAALWLVLPDGSGGWLVLIGLLGLTVLLAIPEWRRQRAGLSRRRWVSALRLGVVVLIVVAGIGVGSRALVETANQPGAALAANPIAASSDSVARGNNLFLANCANCHGQDGGGDGPTGAGLLPPPGPIGPAASTMSDGQLAYVITDGISGTGMPPFATSLSENDRWDLVNYLRSRWPRSSR